MFVHRAQPEVVEEARRLCLDEATRQSHGEQIRRIGAGRVVIMLRCVRGRSVIYVRQGISSSRDEHTSSGDI